MCIKNEKKKQNDHHAHICETCVQGRLARILKENR